MTHPKLKAEESKVKSLLLSGNSKSAVARQLDFTRSKVNKIVGRLLYYGEIVPIPGTTNPVIYVDPEYSDTFSPTGRTEEKSTTTPRVSNSETPLLHNLDPKIGIKNVNMTGISSAKDCPDGYVEAHINGHVSMEIKAIGTREVVRDPSGITVGYWEHEPKPIKGSITYNGVIYIQNIKLSWQYREGNRGKKSFFFYPNRIFLDPKQFNSKEEVSEVFIDFAYFLSSVLSQYGWHLTNPQVRGKIEYAIRDHPIVGLVTKELMPEDGDIQIDTSYGVPEAEIKDPDDFEKARIFADIPSNYLRLNRIAESQGEKIATLDAMASESQRRFEIYDSQFDRLYKIIEKQSALIEELVKNSFKMIELESNILTTQSQQDALLSNDLIRKFTEMASVEAGKDQKDPKEGYQ